MINIRTCRIDPLTHNHLTAGLVRLSEWAWAFGAVSWFLDRCKASATTVDLGTFTAIKTPAEAPAELTTPKLSGAYMAVDDLSLLDQEELDAITSVMTKLEAARFVAASKAQAEPQ